MNNKEFKKQIAQLNYNATDAQAYPVHQLSDFNIEAYANLKDNYCVTKAELQSPFPLVITSWAYEVHDLNNKDAKYKTYHANHINSEFDAEYPDIITIPDRDTLFQLIKDLFTRASELISENYPFEGDLANLNEVSDLTNFLLEYDSITNLITE